MFSDKRDINKKKFLFAQKNNEDENLFFYVISKLEIYWVKWEIPFLPQVKNDLNMFSAHLFEQHFKLVYER